MFDLLTFIVFLVVAMLLGSKTAFILAGLKLLAVIVIFAQPSLDQFHLLLGISCMVALLIQYRINGFSVVKLSLAVMALIHSAIVVSYYLLPYDRYLTVYNSYPSTYLIITALQFIGLWNGDTGQHNIRRWMRDDAHCCRRFSVLFNTCYK